MPDTKISGLTALAVRTLAGADKFAIADTSAAASRSVLGSDLQWLSAQGLSIYNVKDYGALGDNSTDDRAAIQAAIDAVPVGGGIVYFPTGTYIVGGAGLSSQSAGSLTRPLYFLGAGSTASVLKTGSSQTGTTFIQILYGSSHTFDSLGFVSNQTTHKVCIYLSMNDDDRRNLRIRDCRFEGWRGTGVGGTGVGPVYIWKANGVWIDGCLVMDSEYGFFMDQCVGGVTISNNHIINTVASRMVDGIMISSSASTESRVVVQGNYVKGANLDPGGNGANSFGILIYNTPGALIANNVTEDNGANGIVGGGILLGGSSWETSIVNNRSLDDTNGIYLEGDGANTDIGAAGSRRGANCASNSIYRSLKTGIDVSYHAGAQVMGNTIAETGNVGLVVDSDYVTCGFNLVMNCNRIFPRPPQLERAQIRCYAGIGNHFTNNTVIDNRGTLPAQVTGVTRAAESTGLTGTYFYKIVAMNYWGEGPASAETSSITVTNEGIRLNWNSVSGATGYRIYRSDTGTGNEVHYIDLGVVLTYLDQGGGTEGAATYSGNYYGFAFDSTLGHVITGNTIKNVQFAGQEYYVGGTSTSSIRGDNSPNYVNDDRVITLGSDAATNSTTTGAEITGLSASILPGTWIFEYLIIYQSGLTTTGVKFGINHTGTSTIRATSWFSTTGTAAVTAVHDQQTTTTPTIMGSNSTRNKTTTAPDLGPWTDVDTANADMLVHIYGLATVTTVGDIELWHASEVAAASTVKAGSSLRLTRVG